MSEEEALWRQGVDEKILFDLKLSQAGKQQIEQQRELKVEVLSLWVGMSEEAALWGQCVGRWFRLQELK
jgi:hypothetical protein